jgi:hypothetical protein
MYCIDWNQNINNDLFWKVEIFKPLIGRFLAFLGIEISRAVGKLTIAVELTGECLFFVN